MGFAALPSLDMVGTAILLTLLLPLKFALFFVLFISLRLRGRTAFLGALALSNYSEFGLIIAALSSKNGWLSNEWLVILSIAVSISFVITNILYNFAHEFYARHRERFTTIEKDQRLPEDIFIQPCDAPICIIGMGRVGTGAYLALDGEVKGQAWGLDTDKDKILQLQQEGRRVARQDDHRPRSAQHRARRAGVPRGQSERHLGADRQPVDGPGRRRQGPEPGPCPHR